MALALYRKYRPATFADVIGQDHVTEPLMAALGAGRINHAYLFSGPRGCGKTSSARILARSLNCAAGPTPTPCGECDSCQALAPEGPGSLDVIEIDAASHGGVDDARDLRERAFFAPVSSRYKVYIVDEAQMVSTQGFNALLKLVEEPPPFLVFVFATTEPDKVLQTIRSRTHHYPFRLLPPAMLRGLLEGVCESEGVSVEPAVYPLVIRAGGGSARDSLSVLDQLLAGAGPEGVTYSRAVGLLGVTDAALLDDTIEALAAGDGAAAFEAVDRVIEAGHDPRRFASDLLERLRDLVVLDAVPDAVAKGLIDGPADQLTRMSDQAGRLGRATLSRFADIVHTGLVEMRGTTSPRLLLELLCARMLLPAAGQDAQALLQRLERLERHQTLRASVPPAGDEIHKKPVEPRRPAAPEKPSATSTPTSRPAAPEKPAVTQPAATPAPRNDGPVDTAELRRRWFDVLEAVRERRRPTHAMLDQHAQVAKVDGRTAVLSVSSAPMVRVITDEVNAQHIRAALDHVFGGTWTIRCEVASSDSAPPAEAPPPPSAEDDEGAAADDPHVTGPADPTQGTGRTDPHESAISMLRSTLGARPLADGTA